MKTICYGHCFLEFPDTESFSKHVDKVVNQRKQRQKRYLFNKLKKELAQLEKGIDNE